jgi:CubicO group peptidase (beta-lactamase class C family)
VPVDVGRRSAPRCGTGGTTAFRLGAGDQARLGRSGAARGSRPRSPGRRAGLALGIEQEWRYAGPVRDDAERADPAGAGLDPARLAQVVARFERQREAGRFPGGQLVVRRRGVLALSHATGVARGFRAEEGVAPVAVTPTTRFAVFSASKAVVAVAIALLEARGALDVSAKVARFFPEFAANGKGELTVLDVLTHRAGVITLELLAHPEAWGDRAAVRQALIDAVPRWRRGTLGYLPYEYGWILEEVVRGATGKSLRDVVRDELAGPLGLEGLRFGATEDELPSLARAYWLGKGSVSVAGHELSTTFERDNNRPAVLTAFVPAAGLVCTASDLARFYDLLALGGVGPGGARVLSEDAVRRLSEVQVSGIDRSNGVYLRFGRGVMRGTVFPSIFGWWGTQHCLGHAGAFSTLAYADPSLGLSVAIVTNGNHGRYEALARFAPLGSAIRRACR